MFGRKSSPGRQAAAPKVRLKFSANRRQFVTLRLGDDQHFSCSEYGFVKECYPVRRVTRTSFRHKSAQSILQSGFPPLLATMRSASGSFNFLDNAEIRSQHRRAFADKTASPKVFDYFFNTFSSFRKKDKAVCFSVSGHRRDGFNFSRQVFSYSSCPLRAFFNQRKQVRS